MASFCYPKHKQKKFNLLENILELKVHLSQN
jgi:hypothetical protein